MPEGSKQKKVCVETSFVCYLSEWATTREQIASRQVASCQCCEAVLPSCNLFVLEHVMNELPTIDAPIDDTRWICQQIPAQYDYNPHKLHLAMDEEQKRLAREGQVFWVCNAVGELAPLPKGAILGPWPF